MVKDKEVLIVELTPKCNLKCEFCYNIWTESDNDNSIRELTFDEWKETITKILSVSNFRCITFIGGEPLLSPHLEKLIDFCKLNYPEMLIGISSNMTLLNEGRLKNLVKCGLNYVECGLWTDNPSLYHKITKQNLLTQALENLCVVRLNIELMSLAITCSKLNFHEISDLIDLGFIAGVDQLSINPFISTSGRGKVNEKQFILNEEELSELLRHLADKAEKWQRSITITAPLPKTKQLKHSKLKYGVCVCGTKKWVLSYDGTMRFCEHSDVNIGNALTDSISTIFEKGKELRVESGCITSHKMFK